MLSSENKKGGRNIYRPRHTQWLGQIAKILEAPSENLTDMLPPLGRTGSPAMDETPIGNHKYGNRSYSVELEVYTLNGRQRLYDLMLEIRRLCHSRRHSLTNFQRIMFQNFNEEVGEQANIWTGTIDILLENNGVLLET